MHLSKTLAAVGLTFFLGACSSSSDGRLVEGADLTGTWNATSTVTSTNVPGRMVGDMDAFSLDVMFDPMTNEVIIDQGTPGELQGTLNGLQLVLTQANLVAPATAEGKTTIETFTVVLNFNNLGTTFTGTLTESETIGMDTFTETSVLSGTLEGAPSGFGMADAPLSVSVGWDQNWDLDIEVDEPSGETLSRLNLMSMDGGFHDGDNQCDPDPRGETASYKSAPAGDYTLRVINFDSCDDPVVPSTIATVTATPTGASPTVMMNTFQDGGVDDDFEFTIRLQ